jgi:hypothetical protein
MSYTFSIDGRVDHCTIQNAIKRSFFWPLSSDQTYEAEVYLLNLTINSDSLQEIINKCEGNMPPFNPTELEDGLIYCFNSRNPLKVGDTITMQLEYKNGRFSYIGSDMLL